MILACQQICKSFGTDEILRNVSFGIEEHEKAAIVGVNGAGKTTLLKIVTGDMSADSGQVILAKGASMGYLAQQDMILEGRSIYEEALDARSDLLKMEQEIRQLEKQMDQCSGQQLDVMMNRYHRLQTEFERQGGYALRSEVTGVLKGLGFEEDEFSKQTQTLSGGEKTRIALGRLLLSSPDIILLDEPTNHLDIHSIAWLENYLRSYKGSVVIVSHDRYFLNRIVSKVIEISQGNAFTFLGDFSAYTMKKKQQREIQLKAWMKQQQQIRHQEEVIEKLRSFNREKSIKRAESREKVLQKIERIDKPSDDSDAIKMTLEPEVISGNDVLHVEGLSKSFGARQLFSNLSMDIRRGERVALIGDNGIGKTTFLKIINGLEEADSGFFELGTRVMVGYYDQEHHTLNPEKTLFDEISDTWPDLDQTKIRNVLASFLFTGDDVYKQVKDLSGGEQGRLSLAKLMLSNANFLILDEPTNHLDIVSKEVLESALCRYEGTLLYVSHDRYFINETATRILHLEQSGVTGYLGNYDYYLEKSQQLSPSSQSRGKTPWEKTSGKYEDRPASSDGITSSPAGTVSGKEDWLLRKEEQARIRKKKNDLKRTEDEISRLETEDQEIDRQLSLEEIYTDVEKCSFLTRQKAQISRRLEELYALWETLAEDDE